MADIESVLKELICEVIDSEVEIPDDNEIERISERSTELYLEDNLSNHVQNEINENRDVHNIITSIVTNELEARREETQELLDGVVTKLMVEIARHTIAYKFKAIGQWFRSKSKRLFFGKSTNRRKVLLWTCFI